MGFSLRIVLCFVLCVGVLGIFGAIEQKSDGERRHTKQDSRGANRGMAQNVTDFMIYSEQLEGCAV